MKVFNCFLRTASLSSILVLAGCGGGDSGPTGPGGGGGQYQLVGINEDGLPESEVIENCQETLFTSGSLRVNQGNWEMRIEIEQEVDGADSIEDYGTVQRNGNQLRFSSDAFGDQFDGELEGSLVVLYYDFCANGEADVDLVFE